jgi:hypothetical protein
LAGRPAADATQYAFRSNAKLRGSVKNLVGEMDQMFRRHWETRIASVGAKVISRSARLNGHSAGRWSVSMK